MFEKALHNGVVIPQIGCGTWTYTNKEAEKNVLLAIEAGYRLIDTAEYYRNEKGVGAAVRACGLPREDIFVSSKVWKNHYGYKKTMEAFHKSLDRMKLDYLDSYLIHWPAVERKHKNWRELNAETWAALEELHGKGLIRAIGVSNFLPEHLEPLMEATNIVPMINQIEFHPGFMPIKAVEFCQEKGIALQAWSPFGRGEVFQNEELLGIAREYGRSPAQVVLRWIHQHGLAPIVKAASMDHLKNNLNMTDFELSGETMQQIDSIPFFGKLGYDPEYF